MAFVRRKGNWFYLVHNVRRGGKVRQLHLARLGERARITDEVVREVSKKHPFVELNWQALRAQMSAQVDLADAGSPAIQKLVSNLRALNLELAVARGVCASVAKMPRSPQMKIRADFRSVN